MKAGPAIAMNPKNSDKGDVQCFENGNGNLLNYPCLWQAFSLAALKGSAMHNEFPCNVYATPGMRNSTNPFAAID